jgi:RNA polymerase sigma-70 factor (ECF subfamily)
VKISTNERILIKQCKKGDKNAQMSLYTKYYANMFPSAKRIVKNDADAEDIMQDAFLKAFESIGHFKGDVPFGAWLKRIVINKSIDYLRKRRADLFDFGDQGNLMVLQRSDDEIELDDETEMLSKIKKCINDLPDGYRIILSLYLLEGYDHDEIAQIMNITASTSRSQFSRAKKKLANSLNQMNNEKQAKY